MLSLLAASASEVSVVGVPEVYLLGVVGLHGSHATLQQSWPWLSSLGAQSSGILVVLPSSTSLLSLCAPQSLPGVSHPSSQWVFHTTLGLNSQLPTTPGIYA